MAAEQTSRELKIVLERFFALSAREKLSAYRAIRNYLAEGVRETKRDRIVAHKDAALRAIEQVSAHLKLPPGQAPSPDEFDAAAGELGIGWDRSRVRRAWGRWRFAKAAFLGQHLPESTKQRDERRNRTGHWGNREGQLKGVQLWLATDPASLAALAYRDWAREFNENLPPDALPVVTSAGDIARVLRITWADVVRLARGEITREEARPPKKQRYQSYCRGPHQLATRGALQTILKTSKQRALVATRRPDFPAPVIVLPGRRFWLREHLVAYARGRRWSAEENEAQLNSLRDFYMTVEEVSAASGLSAFRIGHGGRGLPLPAVSLTQRLLWVRSEVEEALAKTGQSAR